MTTTTTTVEHGITVTEVHLPAGTPLRAECLCGWKSEIVPSRPKAAAAGKQHTAEASYTDPLNEDALITFAEALAMTRFSAAEVRGCWRVSTMAPRPYRIGTRTAYRRSEVQAWMRSPRIPEYSTGPIVCAPWCVVGDGHGDADFREDQWCGTEELRVTMSLHPELEDERRTDDGVWVNAPDYLAVHGMRRGPEGELTVEMSHAGAPALHFTPSEAQQLVEALQLTLGQVASATMVSS